MPASLAAPLLVFALAATSPAGDLEAADPAANAASGALEPAATPLSAESPRAPLSGDSASAPAASVTRPMSGAIGKYKIGPDDELKVEVVGFPEFAGSAKVTAKGTLILPILHEIDVAGLTTDEVQARLTELLAAGYVRDPKVVVSIAEYNNMKVWVFGYVNEPGEQRLTGPMTILELLSRVGDVKANAGSVVTIERTRTGETQGPDGRSVPYTEADTISVDLDALLRQGDLSQNVPLQNGDKIYVPSSLTKVGIFGEVAKPGFYPFHEGMTLSDIIQAAGGLTEFANQKKIKIKRASMPKPITANLKAFYKDGQNEANVILTEGDIVLVNSSFLF